MAKSMYSLILADEIVREADRMAYARGLSRSNLINQILGEYFMVTTPEQRIRYVFEGVTRAVEQFTMQIPQQPGNSVLQMRNTLRYKYSPTIRYSVELHPGGGGIFRVSCRTQNVDLLVRLHAFYHIWSGVEIGSYKRNNLPEPKAEIEEGRYARKLMLDGEDNLEPQELGEAIAQYIRLFDQGLERFLTLPRRSEELILKEMAQRYHKYMKDAPLYF